MPDGIDLAVLRQLVGGVVAALPDHYTHRELAGVCERLGLPEPPGQDGYSKRDRFGSSFAALPDAALPAVAERIVGSGDPPPWLDAATRNAIQDTLWAGQGAIEIPKRTRREVARDLNLDDLPVKYDRFMALLDRLWVLGSPLDPWTGSAGLRGQIDQHVFRNPGDWSAEDLFEELGAFEAGDARFGKFLEGLASADVIPDEPAQRRVVAAVNAHLHSAGAELRETGTDGGYPVFTVISTRAGRARRPKNIIFASPVKPDLRFTDAVDNDIEIVSNADKVLVYDRPIGPGGIRWSDLQAWWKDERQIPGDEEAKRSLYQRLAGSLPASSPSQRNMFDLYHEIHGEAVPGLPALLPEVWLHWDPKTVRERGPGALRQHRMDFLLLLPHGQRIVLEVDGTHHYAGPDGKASPARYADGMHGDRDLKLAGYGVFRFGAAELQDRDQARDLLRQFFADLFRRFAVTPYTPDKA